MAGKLDRKHGNKHFGTVAKYCIALLVAFNIHTISAFSLSRFYLTPALRSDWNRNNVPDAVESGLFHPEHLNGEKGNPTSNSMMKPTSCGLVTNPKCSNNFVVRYINFNY